MRPITSNVDDDTKPPGDVTVFGRDAGSNAINVSPVGPVFVVTTFAGSFTDASRPAVSYTFVVTAPVGSVVVNRRSALS